ncbi:hypothetical protein [Thermococcus sp. Bubb.Bath]|uniref:hypothetical protein n=1 Tax=Thermococcus sp. Bubb.Bath TaxID=1638242 RepID=UPI001F0D35CF|nr:hypothetical protein [Thermococcus sp. Bubb.Bath]
MVEDRVVIKGRCLEITIDTSMFNTVEPAFPFPIILMINGQILAGACWNAEGGKLAGQPGDPYGLIQELLNASKTMLQKQGEYNTSLFIYFSDYAFKYKDSSLVISYENELLSYTDCPKYKGKYRGIVELPLREFVEDVLRISREYLEKYASIVEEVRLEHGEKPDNYDDLWKLYREVEELYKKRFGTEDHC